MAIKSMSWEPNKKGRPTKGAYGDAPGLAKRAAAVENLTPVGGTGAAKQNPGDGAIDGDYAYATGKHPGTI